MNLHDPGVMAGIVGGVIGVFGGVVGTYFSVANAKPGAERAFIIRISALVWLAVVAMLAWLALVPSPLKFFIWVPYSIGLPLALRAANRRQEALRQAG